MLNLVLGGTVLFSSVWFWFIGVDIIKKELRSDVSVHQRPNSGIDFYYPVAVSLDAYKNSGQLIDKITAETDTETKALFYKINRIVKDNGVLNKP